MRAFWANLPNALSLSRIPAAFLFLVLFSTETAAAMVPALLILAYALVSDFLDGFLARRLGHSSRTGYYLDGLGDRAFSVAILFAITRADPSQIGLAWLLVFREIAIYALRGLDPDQSVTAGMLRRLSVAQAIVIRLYFGAFFVGSFVQASGIPPPHWFHLYGLLGGAAAIIGYAAIALHSTQLVKKATGP
ncbi:MAG: CDP-alcohol phosphatidyltransferase family protein [Devosia nanyangense]|uniref:CDP-alcohol phosphatidyltransferase family protein n=1 Tax=Devosia nanyangense TaxID=1228055 RepID=A0A933L5N7_9HYPH|nr:CDP-alcohol phosphatidyltransferase family protein [Devosia nanyangense]